MPISEIAKIHYQRVFMEQFIAAAGSEPFEIHLNTAINPTLDDFIRYAGRQAGIEFRASWLDGRV